MDRQNLSRTFFQLFYDLSIERTELIVRVSRYKMNLTLGLRNVDFTYTEFHGGYLINAFVDVDRNYTNVYSNRLFLSL